jgi:broad specificity phosphatase PhoE
MTMITKEKLREMMDEFMAVHVEGQIDFIGPNATDAPFFAKFHENMNEWDYLEASDRLYKYRNTQIPWLADKVGVPMEDAEAFLEAMKERGEEAQERMKHTLRRMLRASKQPCVVVN